jgi:hypothetical protein
MIVAPSLIAKATFNCRWSLGGFSLLPRAIGFAAIEPQ